MPKVNQISRSLLLPHLKKIQDKKGFISDYDMQNLAEKFGIHPVEVYSVVTFYSFLLTKFMANNLIWVSNCISSKLAGSDRVVRDFEKALGIKLGQATKDKRFALLETSCIGMCDQAPAIMVNGKLIGKVNKNKIKQIVKTLKAKR